MLTHNYPRVNNIYPGRYHNVNRVHKTWKKNGHVKKSLTLEIGGRRKRIPLLLPKVSVMINSIMKIFLPKDRVFLQKCKEAILEQIAVLHNDKRFRSVGIIPDVDEN